MEKKDEIVKIKPRFRWWKRLIVILLIFGVLFYGIFLAIFKLPSVQNYLAEKVMSQLSEKLHTDVNVGEVSFSFFDKLVLHDLYIADINKDTLAMIDRLETHISSGFWAVLNKDIALEDIKIKGIKTTIIRYPKDGYNFSFDVSKNSKKNADKLAFELGELDIEDIDAIYLDSVNGNYYSGEIKSILAEVDFIDLEEKEISICNFKVDNPNVFLVKNSPEDDFEDEEVITNNIDIDTSQTKGIALFIDDLRVEKGVFSYDKINSEHVEVAENSIDFKRLRILDINMYLAGVSLIDKVMNGMIVDVNAKEKSGFELTSLYSGAIKVTNRKAEFVDLLIKTPFSEVGNKFSMKYKSSSDFSDFVNKVYMKGDLVDSKIHFKDLMYFASTLRNNKFFIKNIEKYATLNGKFSGKTNSLKGKNVDLYFSKNLHLVGEFTSQQLTIKDERSARIELRDLQTDIKTLRELIPGFYLPENYNKLGKIHFKGHFGGFFNDFAAYGELTTELGRAKMDLGLNIKEGKEKAKYEGNLDLDHFDLGQWTGNGDFGFIDFKSKVFNGEGLNAETANAELFAEVGAFEYKNYSYENIEFTGRITKNLLDGTLSVKDENVDLDFTGNIDFTTEIPHLDFRSMIENVNLKKLNLIEENVTFSTNLVIKMDHFNIDDAIGSISISDLKLTKDDTLSTNIKSINLNSEFSNEGMKKYELKSSIANASIIGDFHITDVVKAAKNFVFKNHRPYAQQFLGIDSLYSISKAIFDFDLEIYDLKKIPNYFGIPLDGLENSKVRAEFNSNEWSYVVSVDIPEVVYDEKRITSLVFDSEGEKSTLASELSIDQIILANKKKIPQTDFRWNVVNDTTYFNVQSKDWAKGNEVLFLKAELYPIGDGIRFHIDPNSLVLFEDFIDIDKENELILKRESISFFHFVLEKDMVSINIRDYKDRGLKVDVENIELSLIDSIWDHDKFNFSGIASLDLTIEDVFKLKGLNASILSQNLILNDDDWGKLTVDVKMESLSKSISSNVKLEKDEMSITLDGVTFLKKAMQNTKWEGEKAHVNHQLKVKNFPLNFFEYLIGTGIKDTKGLVNGECLFFGDIKQLNASGNATVTDGELIVKYTNVKYFIPNESVVINNFWIDATDAHFYDEFGNEATLTGGLKHQYLKNLELDVSGVSERLLSLNTTKDLNPLYYGRAIGAVEASFEGPFDKTDIAITATTARGTNLSIPISYEQDSRDLDYVNFVTVKKDSFLDKGVEEELGLDIVMDLTLTDESVGKIIFDEVTGDIIEAKGHGDIKVEVKRSGEFNVYGDYEMIGGEYLFTLYNIVYKPFEIDYGSKITWSGDPLKADMAITAKYKGLTSSVYNLLSDYTLEGDILSAARERTDIDLKLLLNGNLLSPDISFDIEVPKITGSLKNIVDSKLKLLSQNQDELNRHVFGLILFNSFFPTNLSNGAQQVNSGDFATNTLSQLLSNQVSIFVEDLLNQIVDDVDAISSVDFDVFYARDQFVKNAFDVKMKWHFFDDKFSINLGPSVKIFNPETSGLESKTAYFDGDMELEYALSKDGRLKIRMLISTVQEERLGDQNRALKGGIGFRYSRDFDHLTDLFK